MPCLRLRDHTNGGTICQLSAEKGLHPDSFASYAEPVAMSRMLGSSAYGRHELMFCRCSCTSRFRC